MNQGLFQGRWKTETFIQGKPGNSFGLPFYATV